MPFKPGCNPVPKALTVKVEEPVVVNEWTLYLMPSIAISVTVPPVATIGLKGSFAKTTFPGT
jgi:hypothetical protein